MEKKASEIKDFFKGCRGQRAVIWGLPGKENPEAEKSKGARLKERKGGRDSSWEDRIQEGQKKSERQNLRKHATKMTSGAPLFFFQMSPECLNAPQLVAVFGSNVNIRMGAYQEEVGCRTGGGKGCPEPQFSLLLDPLEVPVQVPITEGAPAVMSP